MKFGGKKLEAPRATLVLKGHRSESLEIQIQAIPPGLKDKAERLFPEPPPPREYAVAAGTGKTIKDSLGRPIKEPNYDDPDWRQKSAESTTLQTAVILEFCLRVDENITFEATQGSDDRAFYRAVWEEIRDSGLTKGEVLGIVDKAMEISRLGEEELIASAENFCGAVNEGKPEGDEKAMDATQKIGAGS